MVKNNLLVLLLILSIGLNIFLLVKNNEGKIKETNNTFLSYKRADKSRNLPLKQSATCNFERDVSVTYPTNDDSTKDREIEFTLNKDEQPVSVSFINLDTEEPIMRGNGGQSDLIKVIDTDDVVTVVEKNPVSFGTLQVFSIFKNTGIGIWSKQYDLFGTPFGLISMAYCD